MGKKVDPPSDNPGDIPPGDPGYVPPTGSDTKIALVVTGSSVTVASDLIAAAGGPWLSFIFKVTPVNDRGVGSSQEVTCSVSGDIDYDGGGA